MVALALILPALWVAASAPGDTPERDPLVFAAREGWRARLMYVAEPERALKYAEAKWEAQRALKDPQVTTKAVFPLIRDYLERAAESFNHAALIVSDTAGSYVACYVKLEGRSFEVGSLTQAVLYMRDGTRLKSTVLVGLGDPHGRRLYSTGVETFTVSDALAKAESGPVMLYLRFSGPVDLEEVSAWRLNGYR